MVSFSVMYNAIGLTYCDIGGSVNKFVNLGSSKVVVRGVESSQLAAVAGDGPGLADDLAVHLHGGELAQGSLPSLLQGVSLSKCYLHILKWNLREIFIKQI